MSPVPSAPAKRTLFLIRGKLGDSLVNMMCVVEYARRHPEEKIFVLIRRAYAGLFEGLPGIELLPFDSSAELLWLTLRTRLGGGIDKLAVIWAFGSKMPWVARLSGAKLRAYLDHRFPEGVFTHIAPDLPVEYLCDVGWRVTCLLDPDVARPDRLTFANLARRRKQGEYVALVPIADEVRRCLDHEHFCLLVEAARERFPGVRLVMFGNLRDAPLRALMERPLPPDVEFIPFSDVPTLVERLAHCVHLLTVDTGVSHLACAMEVPTTVFFGPTEPAKIILPAQQHVETVRLPALGPRNHCEVKHCRRPLCLYGGLREWASKKPLASETLLDDCLLLTERT